jgi:DGQHR domain-containing protein
MRIHGAIGLCGSREVFLGFAAAKDLVRLSFADTFDETNNTGYQRPFNRSHSVEFKKYIGAPGATTIPLTFNLRPSADAWEIERQSDGRAILTIRDDTTLFMAQVDCQHRLGFMGDSETPFAFMAFLGLDVREEITIFRDINGKAKGLSSSLLDSTEAQLAGDLLHKLNPELYCALQLSEHPKSPWKGRLDKGGKPTLGMTRTASIRTMQNAIRRFFKAAPDERCKPIEETTAMLIDYWQAVVLVLPTQWRDPRHHMLTKGIGVYALLDLAADLCTEARKTDRACTADYFVEKLSNFLHLIDWTNDGPMKGFGGTSGAKAATQLLRHTRARPYITVEAHGKQKHPAH